MRKMRKRATKLEQQQIKAKILELFGKGLTKHDIEKIVLKSFSLSSRQFYRYWLSAMDVETSRLRETKNDFIVGFISRELNRVREASLNYEQSKDRFWLRLSHEIDVDLFDRLQSIGVIEQVADKIELSLEGRLLNAIKKAREFKQ